MRDTANLLNAYVYGRAISHASNYCNEFTNKDIMQVDVSSHSNKHLPSHKLLISLHSQNGMLKSWGFIQGLHFHCQLHFYALIHHMCTDTHGKERENCDRVETRQTVNLMSSFMTHVFSLHSTLPHHSVAPFLALLSRCQTIHTL